MSRLLETLALKRALAMFDAEVTNCTTLTMRRLYYCGLAAPSRCDDKVMFLTVAVY